MPSDWLERISSKWPILCRVGHTTLTQSIHVCGLQVTVNMSTDIGTCTAQSLLWYLSIGLSYLTKVRCHLILSMSKLLVSYWMNFMNVLIILPVWSLWPPSRARHYILLLCFLLSFFFFFSSPVLSSHRLDVYHTSTHDVALVRI